MRLLPLNRVPDGAELGRDVSTGRVDRIPLLRAGTRMNARYREALEREGVGAIYVRDEGTEGIEPQQILSEATRAAASHAVARTLGSARAAMEAGRPLPAEALAGLDAIVIRMTGEIGRVPPLGLALADLSAAGSYTLEHAIDTAAIALLIGQRVFRERGYLDYLGHRSWDRIDVRLTHLGLGALLHDIGKLAIPPAVQSIHPAELSPPERELLRRHTLAGLEILSSDLISPLVKIVVRSHHEHWDGGGYPDRRSREDINELARITAIADVYDAITSERVYAPAQPPHVAVRAIREGRGTRFDPELVDAFSKVVAPFPPGETVELSDGRWGVVASVPENHVDRPVVRVFGDGYPHDLALAEHPSVRIVGWDDMDPPPQDPRRTARNWAI